MAQLRRLPPGTLPPVVLKFDASSLPVCLVTVKGRGPERNAACTTWRNSRCATRLPACRALRCRSRSAASTGRSWSTSIRTSWKRTSSASWTWCASVNDSNLILPAGDVRIGPYDYNIYTNSQLPDIADIDHCRSRRWARPGAGRRMWVSRRTRSQIQTNVVRVDGQRSVYMPVLKQGGDTNTIAVVDGVRKSHQQSVRCSEGIGHQSGFRSIAVREDGDSRRWCMRAASACS